MRKRARLIGSTLRARSRAEKAALVRRFREEILPAFQTGALRVTVDSVLPPTRAADGFQRLRDNRDRKSTRLNSSHVRISYAVFCLKKKTKTDPTSSALS